jgi:transcriptional regulator with XRE-family HTH domain
MTEGPISPAAKAFGDRVRARRHELGESQEDLASVAGLHWTFVGQVERGRRNISLHNILKLAHALEIDPGDLMRALPWK